MTQPAILLFARYPRLGGVKTRLQPILGPQGCFELHQAMLLDTVERLEGLPAPTFLYLADCTPAEAHSFFRHHFAGRPLRIRIQSGADLGERIWNAAGSLKDDFDGFIVVGGDSPTLPMSTLRAALERLEQTPVVICPVADGGYCLLGARPLSRRLLEAIPWGTSTVCATTVSRAAPNRVEFLPPWYDVDREADLIRLASDLSTRGEGHPERTALCLNRFRGTGLNHF